LCTPAAGQGTGLAHGRPSPTTGFTPEGYKRPPVRVTQTYFLSRFQLTPRILVFFSAAALLVHRRFLTAVGLGIAVRGRDPRHALGSIFASLFLFLFLEYPNAGFHPRFGDGDGTG
jgi:hypothetical protein